MGAGADGQASDVSPPVSRVEGKHFALITARVARACRFSCPRSSKSNAFWYVAIVASWREPLAVIRCDSGISPS